MIGIFGDQQARVITLTRRGKKLFAVAVGKSTSRGTIAVNVASVISRVAVPVSIYNLIIVA